MRIKLSVQKQNVKTQEERVKAEQSRELAEKASANADKAYMSAINMNADQYLKMKELDNQKFNKKIQDKPAYQEYDNYDAIEIPLTMAIPSDYTGIMGVPISFLDKYNPEQFEILGMCENEDLYMTE